tara:strand:- start:72663 stop:72875 length:213 start_codon:yes stop_codon:yes gene_type:complete
MARRVLLTNRASGPSAAAQNHARDHGCRRQLRRVGAAGRLDTILHVEPVRGRRVHVAIDELKDQRVVVGR